eukprot:m.122227 g.122227  ORF g.122227 m.122227 type:complete len:67 (+) comp37767_c0_seq48:857-1057(+)
MENHHLRVARELVENHSILKNLAANEKEEFDALLESMILSTDLKHHEGLLHELNTTTEFGKKQVAK